jgi:hypothetical protein
MCEELNQDVTLVAEIHIGLEEEYNLGSTY